MSDAKFKVDDEVFFFSTSSMYPILCRTRVTGVNYYQSSDTYDYSVKYGRLYDKLMQPQSLFKTKEEALASIPTEDLI